MTTYKSSAIKNTALYDALQERLHVAEVVFRESDGSAAGVYTGSVELPGGAVLIDLIVYAEALWTADTSAVMDVGDAADPNGYFASIDLKATDLLAGESVSFDHAGGEQGVYVVNTLTEGTPNTEVLFHVNRRYTAGRRTITGVITTVGTVGTAGITRMVVVYALPGTRATATFVAS